MLRSAIAVFTVFLLLFCSFGSALGEQEMLPAAQAGTDVSGFASALLEGSPIDGSVFAGYELCILTYWATWSGPALKQLGYLQQLHSQHPEIGVFGILYTDSTSTPAAAQSYMQAQGYGFGVFTPDEVWAGVLSQAAFMPQSFFVSPNGIILEAWPGAFTSASAMYTEAEQWLGGGSTYTVRFYDGFGGNMQLLAEHTNVAHGASITPPAAPFHMGGKFVGWSTEGYGYVTCDMDVVAIYEPRCDGDVDGNGQFNSLDTLELLRVLMGMTPINDRIAEHGDFDMNGKLDSLDALHMLRTLMGLEP